MEASRSISPARNTAFSSFSSLRKGTTLTKEMFLNHLYGGMDEPELKIIDVFVCKLRKKLAQATGGENYIETVWGRGYVLRDPAPADVPPQAGEARVGLPPPSAKRAPPFAGAPFCFRADARRQSSADGEPLRRAVAPRVAEDGRCRGGSGAGWNLSLIPSTVSAPPR